MKNIFNRPHYGASEFDQIHIFFVSYKLDACLSSNFSFFLPLSQNPPVAAGLLIDASYPPVHASYGGRFGALAIVSLHFNPYRKSRLVTRKLEKGRRSYNGEFTDTNRAQEKNLIFAKFFLPVVATVCEPDATALFGPGRLGVQSETGELLLVHVYRQKVQIELDEQGCNSVKFAPEGVLAYVYPNLLQLTWRGK